MRRLGYFVMSIIFAEKENCFGLKNNFKINIRKLQKHKGSKCHVLANFNKCTSDISLFYFLTNLKGDMYIVNYVWCPVELFTPYLVVGWLQRMIFFLPDYTRQYVLTYLPNCFHSPNSHLPSFHTKYLPSICQYYSEFESHLTDFVCHRSSHYDFLPCYWSLIL